MLNRVNFFWIQAEASGASNHPTPGLWKGPRMRQEQIVKSTRPRRRPAELQPLGPGPDAPDLTDAEALLARIDATLAVPAA